MTTGTNDQRVSPGRIALHGDHDAVARGEVAVCQALPDGLRFGQACFAGFFRGVWSGGVLLEARGHRFQIGSRSISGGTGLNLRVR